MKLFGQAFDSEHSQICFSILSERLEEDQMGLLATGFFTPQFFAFRIKIPYPLQWGAPTFDAGHAFGMMAAVLVSLIEVLPIQEYQSLR